MPSPAKRLRDRRPLAAAALLVLLASAGTVAAADGPGTLVARALCYPTFTVDGAARRTGQAFVLDLLGTHASSYLLTAQHLFGVDPPAMPTRASAVECPAAAGDRRVTGGAAVAIPDAHPMGDLPRLRDVAAFPLAGRPFGLTLATRDVAPGARVWLLARVKSGRETDRLLHGATVISAGAFLAYRYDNDGLELDQTSGAPVLDDSGRVVGLNIGYTRDGAGRQVGVADSLTVLQQVVAGLR